MAWFSEENAMALTGLITPAPSLLKLRGAGLHKASFAKTRPSVPYDKRRWLLPLSRFLAGFGLLILRFVVQATRKVRMHTRELGQLALAGGKVGILRFRLSLRQVALAAGKVAAVGYGRAGLLALAAGKVGLLFGLGGLARLIGHRYLLHIYRSTYTIKCIATHRA